MYAGHEPGSTVDRYWWKVAPDEAPGRIWSHLSSLVTWRSLFLQRRAAMTSIYERESWVPNLGRFYTDAQAQQLSAWAETIGMQLSSSPSLNALNRYIRFMANRLGEDTPAIEIAPYDGNDDQTRRAATATAVLDATMNAPEARAEINARLLTGLKLGWCGCLPEYRNGRICFSKVSYEDCWWDPQDARGGMPQSFHVARLWSRSELAAFIRASTHAQIADRRDDLLDRLMRMPATTSLGPGSLQGANWRDPYDRHMSNSVSNYVGDQLWVVQSWRLPGGPDSPEYEGKWTKTAERDLCLDAGRHLITVHGGDGEPLEGFEQNALWLYDGPWKRTTFPVVWWTPGPHEKGIDGVGMGDLLEPYQNQVDHMWSRFGELVREWGSTLIAISSGMRDQKENIAGDGVKFVELPPAAFGRGGPGFQVIPRDPMSEQQLRFLDNVLAKMAEFCGVNPGGPSGQTSLGANAPGIALVEEQANQDLAIADIAEQWTHFLLRLGEETVYTICDASKADRTFSLPYADEFGDQRRQCWADLFEGLNRFHIQLEPVGVLGKSKSGRIARLVEYGRLGGVPPQLAADFVARSPDVKRMQRLANAGVDLVNWQLDGICEVGKDEEYYAQYNPGTDTPYERAIELARARSQIARRRGTEDEVLVRLDSYIMACQDALEEQQAALAPPPMPGMEEMGAPAGPEGLGAPGIQPAPEPGIPGLPPLPM